MTNLHEIDEVFEQLRKERDKYQAAYEMAERALEGQCRMLLDMAERTRVAEERVAQLQGWVES